MDITPIDDEERLFVSSRIDDRRRIDAHRISVVADLESTFDTGIPSGDGTRLCLEHDSAYLERLGDPRPF